MSVKLNQTIEERLQKLDEKVRWFEGDDFELEKAVERFKEAEGLADEIEKDLTSLKNEIIVLKQSFDTE
ncbi:exodeoxyribonuclease VII small subunit [Microbacteriaceae bacterium]|nr:exodeoxyribonuclease VII small subunit [Candidatus Saccharibacteria bacterium]